MTANQRDQRDQQAARRNRDDLSVLLELRDIEDELATILKLLEQQDSVIKSMKKYFDRKNYGKMFLDIAQSRIDEYRTQIEEMKSNSHTAQKAVCIAFSNFGLTLALTLPGGNTSRPQTKASKCRRGQNGPMAG